MYYKRLVLMKEALLLFYAKRKKQKYAPKLVKALKKVFGAGRKADYE